MLQRCRVQSIHATSSVRCESPRALSKTGCRHGDIIPVSHIVVHNKRQILDLSTQSLFTLPTRTLCQPLSFDPNISSPYTTLPSISTTTHSANMVPTNDTPSSSTTTSILTPLINQANVIATQTRSRQDYWTSFTVRSEANLDRFDIAKRLLVSDSEFALKLLELAVEVAEKVQVGREELVEEKKVQMEELKGVKEDVEVFKSVYEQKKALEKATAAFEFHANDFADKIMGIQRREDVFDKLVARNAELEAKLKVLEMASTAAAVQKMKEEDIEIEFEG